MYLRLARLRRYHGTLPNESEQTDERGTLDTLYFDSDDWAVRLMTLRFEHEPGRPQVPVLPPTDIVSLNPTSEQIEFEPHEPPYRLSASERFKPLSPQATNEVWHHYRVPPFWRGTQVWGDVGAPGDVRSPARVRPGARESQNRARRESRERARPGDQSRRAAAPTLEASRPVRADVGARELTCPRTDDEPGETDPPTLYPHTLLMGRGVFSPDGRLGVISDLLLEMSSWRIRYFIVWVQAPGETGEILLSPYWVTGAPEKSRVTVPMTTEAIVSGPTFVPEDLAPLDEQILARYFGFLRD